MKKGLAFILAVIMVLSLVPSMFASANDTVSLQDILTASANLKVYIDTYCSLPDRVEVGSQSLNTAQYYKLACDAVISIYDGGSTTFNVMSVDLPQNPADDVTDSFRIYVDEEIGRTMTDRRVNDTYYDMSQRNSDFIVENGLAANYCSYKSGRNSTIRISFPNLVYSWSKILNYYNTNGALPNYVTVYSWDDFAQNATTPVPTATPVPTPTVVPTPTPESVLTQAAKDSAERTYYVIETKNAVPVYITIGAQRFSASSFLEIAARIVSNTYNDTIGERTFYYIRKDAECSGENTAGGTLTVKEYVETAEHILAYYQASGRAVSYVNTSIGTLGFETLVNMYCNIIALLNINGSLPETVAVKPWSAVSGTALELPKPTQTVVLPTPTPVATPTPKPTPLPTAVPTIPVASEAKMTVNREALVKAAVRSMGAAAKSKALPLYITVDSSRLTASDFVTALAAFVADTANVNVPVYNSENPEKSAEDFAGGTLLKEEYTELAKKICSFVRYNAMVPGYVDSSIGCVSYEALFFMLCDIAAYYSENGTLPESITVKSYALISGAVMPTPDTTSEVTPPPTPTPVPTAVPVPTPVVESTIEGDTFKRGATGTNGAVSSSSAYASKIGLDILQAGGNAIDAAVATMFAVGLCEPSGSSLGGGGLAVVYLAEENRYLVVDYMMKAPASGGSTSTLARMACVPGMVHGAITMLEKYGTMTLAEVMNPTIELAKSGFIVGDEFVYRAGLINKSYDYPVQLFTHDSEGGTLQNGDTFRNEDLAKILENIRDGGIEYFYNSSFTDEIVSYFKSINGAFVKSDFTTYTTLEHEPLTTTYRGHKVYAGSGSAQGGSRVVSMLNKMSNYDMSSYAHDSAQAVRASAVSFGMTSRGSSMNVKTDVLSLLDDVVPYDNKTTTMLTTYDQWGNAVAANVTLGRNYGCSIAVPGTGFCFNSGMGTSDRDGERVMSTMAPAIVAGTNGLPMLMVGSPGDQAIITATAVTISNMLDFDMNVCEAVNAPRWFGYASSSSMTIETRYSAETRNQLKNWGYSLTTSEGEYSTGVGCVSAIHVDENGNIMSAADYRREYMSFAY